MLEKVIIVVVVAVVVLAAGVAWWFENGSATVSYTHLTLPTNSLV